jgi:hypothetical protein
MGREWPEELAAMLEAELAVIEVALAVDQHQAAAAAAMFSGWAMA